jgi:uncharacterized linocin/CFP29 family protein
VTVRADNLNRNQLWTNEVWKDTDAAVLAQMGSIRVAQKVIPTTPMPGAPNVPADVVNLGTMTIAEGRTQPLIEIFVEYTLAQSQLENESALHTNRTLAKLSAKSLALAEDLLIFQGAKAQVPKTVKVVNGESAGRGLLGEAQTIEVPSRRGGKGGFSGDHIFKAVTDGISKLVGLGHPGLYFLILEPSLYAETYAPAPATLVTTADRLIPLVPAGFYASAALPSSTALLGSTGGAPCELYMGSDAVTAYTQEEADGRHAFRLFERFQFVVRDNTSLIRLVFPDGT